MPACVSNDVAASVAQLSRTSHHNDDLAGRDARAQLSAMSREALERLPVWGSRALVVTGERRKHGQRGRKSLAGRASPSWT